MNDESDKCLISGCNESDELLEIHDKSNCPTGDSICNNCLSEYSDRYIKCSDCQEVFEITEGDKDEFGNFTCAECEDKYDISPEDQEGWDDNIQKGVEGGL